VGVAIHEQREEVVVMDTPPPDHRAANESVVQLLIDEHVHISCDIVPIDDTTWAIHGSIAVDGDVILAEFEDPADAESALQELSAAEETTEGLWS
jgi:hypothetical protein